jgi:PAS domain S-box-containing protein
MTGRANPFDGGGEVRALGRSLDWGATPLGPVAHWSPTLRGAVRTCLDSPFPINLWCGPDLILIYNDAYRRVLGAKHPRALGRPGSEVWSEIWDEIAPLFEQIRAGGPPVYEEDAPFVVRRSADEADNGDGGPNAWFTFSLSGIRDESGDLVACLNVVSESTRRILAERAREVALGRAERAEARLREVFAQAPSFLAVLRGPDHVFEYVNEAYYRLVGHRDLIGRPAFEALPEVRGQGFQELLDRVRETGEPFVGREVKVMVARAAGADLEERYLDLVYYPISEPDGSSGVVAHGSDVTEHVEARREAQHARALAEEASRAKTQFLATMSHEIRTPINAVMGYADLLDASIAGALTEPQRKYVSAIHASSRHLLGLVSGILDLAKIEAGELVVRVQQIDPRPAVERALTMMAKQAEDAGLSLTERWDCDSGLYVLADEDRVRQVLLNLLSNAMKFTDPGGTITVRCGQPRSAPPDAALPEMGPWVEISVEDTGRGIAPDQLARVFDPFVQAESGHTRRTGGTGLGLTISRRLARLMGGELTARSEPGQGSTFSLWLAPATQERVAARVAPDASPRSWPPEVDQLPGLAAAGRALLGELDRVEQTWVDRLLADPHVRAAERTNRAQAADQTAELVAAMAKVMYVLEEGGGDPALLDDAESILAVVARRHGMQRRRLGWSRGELEREYHLLGEVLDAVLRREAPKRTAAGLDTALVVIRRLVQRAAGISIAVFDGVEDGDGSA